MPCEYALHKLNLKKIVLNFCALSYFFIGLQFIFTYKINLSFLVYATAFVIVVLFSFLVPTAQSV